MNLPHETAVLHNRIKQCTHVLLETAVYWRQAGKATDPIGEAHLAFEERWFGAKSLARVRVLLTCLRARYAAYPQAHAALSRWANMEPDTRRLISHWHLQLTDPLYRAFTGDYLPVRRDHGTGNVDFHAALQWVKSRDPGRWGPTTHAQFAGKLLTASWEAGLVSKAPDPRRILLPSVGDQELSYLLYLLRETVFTGSLTRNPYLASVGLSEGFLDRRLQTLSCLTYRKMAGMEEFVWRYPSFSAWAEATL